MAKGQSRGNREPKKPKSAKPKNTTAPARVAEPASEGTAGIGCESTEVMTDEPVNLDGHRGMAAQRNTEIRRAPSRGSGLTKQRYKVARKNWRIFSNAAPAVTRAEAAACARYLLQLFAATPEAQDPRRQRLIACTLDDLARFAE